jgi:hypothetical protein
VASETTGPKCSTSARTKRSRGMSKRGMAAFSRTHRGRRCWRWTRRVQPLRYSKPRVQRVFSAVNGVSANASIATRSPFPLNKLHFCERV